MASNHTEHLGLSQWTTADRVTREDFNADNAIIDAALTGAASFVVGAYTGDGTQERFIDLGFTPKAVLLADGAGFFSSSGTSNFFRGGFAISDYGSTGLAITDGGFTVTYTTGSNMLAYTNVNTRVYHYLAFK